MPSLKGLKEIVSILIVRFKVSLFNITDFVFNLRYYFRSFSFFKRDFLLFFFYYFKNPFRLSRRFAETKGKKDIYTYGETALQIVEEVAHRCNLSSQDHFFELGCGRGRACFWLASFFSCKITGIDEIPFFIRTAEKIQSYSGCQKTSFIVDDFFTADLSKASVIYFYAICLEDEEIKKMIHRFNPLKKGTKIITVSFSLADYESTTSYKIVDSFDGFFAWGKGTIYIQTKQ